MKLGLESILSNSRACTLLLMTHCRTAIPWGMPRKDSEGKVWLWWPHVRLYASVHVGVGNHAHFYSLLWYMCLWCWSVCFSSCVCPFCARSGIHSPQSVIFPPPKNIWIHSCSKDWCLFFLMWTIFKVFIQFVTVLLLFYALVFWPRDMWDLKSLKNPYPLEGEILTTRPPGKSQDWCIFPTLYFLLKWNNQGRVKLLNFYMYVWINF